jgi:hypothetical protein
MIMNYIMNRKHKNYYKQHLMKMKKSENNLNINIDIF